MGDLIWLYLGDWFLLLLVPVLIGIAIGTGITTAIFMVRSGNRQLDAILADSDQRMADTAEIERKFAEITEEY